MTPKRLVGFVIGVVVAYKIGFWLIGLVFMRLGIVR